MTFLRWAGSKKQVGEILSHCWFAAQAAGGNGRYAEAFCGSASLFFHLKPSRSVLVDINADLIDCFRAVRTDPQGIAEQLRRYPVSESHYYRLRKLDTEGVSAVERAAIFIYLNRYCFNGLYRTNSQGKFNVPFGGLRTGALPNAETLQYFSDLLQTSELMCADFEFALTGNISKGDFIYVDPPYAKRNHSLDFQYGPDVFGVNDLQRLFDLLMNAHNKGAYFVFSYAECEEVAQFAEGWNSFVIEVQRNIAADASRRGRAREILVSNI
jgi:DNA adenine methylase